MDEEDQPGNYTIRQTIQRPIQNPKPREKSQISNNTDNE